MEASLVFLKGELVRFVRRELPLRKRRRNIQSFDDLLIRFRAALERETQGTLAERVRRKYKAALVDEFQDTDPVQYAIFRSIFEQGDSTLFLIGDPKQAIYSFRGADLFAYIKAAGHVDTKYTLQGNRRSEPSLIAAINAVFSNRENPFFYRDIAFEPAFSPYAGSASVSSAGAPGLLIDGRADAPLRLWIMDGAITDRPDELISKSAAYEEIPDAVAAEISRLIGLGRAGRATIGGERVRESDIAVLVRKNREARLIQKALTARSIPSVLFSMENIFDTPEAEQMQRLLAAIAEPDREDLIRAALVTDMLGTDAQQLEMLMHDDSQWEALLSRFREYYDLWERYGFIRMFRSFLLKEGVRERLLGRSDGERRLTNVLHLGESLHQAACGIKGGSSRGISGLVKWLSRQRDPDQPRLEEDQIRLESDAEAVKIVTVHKSKGLEYPIVFCPFNWDGSRLKGGESFAFHDREDDWKLKLVIDAEGNPNRRAAEEEMLAENLRLLYVSLTRAKQRCYLVWGRFRDAGTSALAYLFHGGVESAADADPGDVLAGIESRFNDLTDMALRRELRPLVERGLGSVRVSDMPSGSGMARIIQLPAADAPPLKSRIFMGLRDRDWQIASFSSLLAGSHTTAPLGSAEAPDHDRIGAGEPVTADAVPAEHSNDIDGGLFGFPGGTRAGIFFHELLEQLDFTEPDESVVGELVARRLQFYGYGSEWKTAVCRMLQNLLKRNLDPGCPALSLGNISWTERLTELEFYFPLKPVTPARLKKVFAGHGIVEDETGIAQRFPERIGRLGFQPAQGFMKGYIDLIFRSGDRFYLVDWKSNYLGDSREDYGRDRLGASMIEACYFLQYHIYTLALDAYLRTRIPDYDYDRHFGGVFYIFLRGIASQSDGEHGIFRDRPSRALIEALREALIAPVQSSEFGVQS